MPWRRIRRFIPARAGNTRAATSPRAACTVHPRSRGEHEAAARVGQGVGGSSPLARGTRWRRPARQRWSRFIPARAGNTRSSTPSSPSRPVHPRSRGEHAGAARAAGGGTGSSPLARGTQFRSLDFGFDSRFIPARAGNTSWPKPRCKPAAVHPRSRGEHVDRPTFHSTEHTVHPRSRGEHYIPLAPGFNLAGSSPLARGTRHRPPHARGLCRFIPARAGNTWAFRSNCCSSAVHPRSRGEHLGVMTLTPAMPGSSPLARGTQAEGISGQLVGRFIPARAGNTAGSTSRRSLPSVHPRSRGEHRACRTPASTMAGSSPLARGTHAFCALICT